MYFNKKNDIHKKILFIASVYSHIAAFHLPFIEILQEKGYEIHVAAGAKRRRKEIENFGVKCWDIEFSRSPYNLKNLKAYSQLKKLLKQNYYSLIHVHTPLASFIGRFLAKRNNQGPILYTAHGFHFLKGASLKNWLIYYTAEHFAAKWTDGILVMNEEDYQNAKKMGFQESKSLFFVPGVGVDIDKHNYKENSNVIRQELGIENNSVVISCIGEFNNNKNQSFLLKTWSKITNHTNAQLLLVGNGKTKHILEKNLRENDTKNVFFLGYRNDVPQILKETDILVSVSKREGLPRVVMEAMAAGKPVIATNVRGSRDLVEHNKSGYLVTLGSENELSEALIKLINNEDLREEMGIRSKEKIKNYSIENTLNEMEKIYQFYLNNS